MAEQIDLTSPLVANPTQTSILKLDSFYYSRSRAVMRVEVIGNNIMKPYEYSGPVATDLINLLNKANCSATSFDKRIFNRLIADGYLSGTISGTPD